MAKAIELFCIDACYATNMWYKTILGKQLLCISFICQYEFLVAERKNNPVNPVNSVQKKGNQVKGKKYSFA